MRLRGRKVGVRAEVDSARHLENGRHEWTNDLRRSGVMESWRRRRGWRRHAGGVQGGNRRTKCDTLSGTPHEILLIELTCKEKQHRLFLAGVLDLRGRSMMTSHLHTPHAGQTRHAASPRRNPASSRSLPQGGESAGAVFLAGWAAIGGRYGFEGLETKSTLSVQVEVVGISVCCCAAVVGQFETERMICTAAKLVLQWESVAANWVENRRAHRSTQPRKAEVVPRTAVHPEMVPPA